MPHNRYYLDIPFQENKTVTLADEEFHHLSRVLRVRVGDAVELVNGHGQLAHADLVELTKKEAKLGIKAVEESKPKPPLILAQALTRMNHLEWIIEKGTELGATSFWLFPGILSEKDELSKTQSARLEHLTISAMKQCGRLDLPSIEVKPPLLKWTPVEGTLLFGNPRAPYLWEIGLSQPVLAPTILLIGPESGFEEREIDFMETTLQAKGVRLHSNILRAETASLTALSLIQQYL